MITELLLDFAFALFGFVVTLIPSTPPPGWLSDGSSMLAEIWTAGSGLGAWVPWALAGTVVTAVLACAGIGLVIKLARIVASFATFGGGSAA